MTTHTGHHCPEEESLTMTQAIEVLWGLRDKFKKEGKILQAWTIEKAIAALRQADKPQRY